MSILSAFPLHFAGFDAFEYHLPRIQYYLMTNSLIPFSVEDIRLIVFPNGYELVNLWAVLFTRSVRVIAAIQTVSVVIAGIGIFAACRAVGASRPVSAITAMLGLIVPDVLWHSLWIKNDLMTAAYCIAALAFALQIEREPRLSIVGFSLSSALAAGVKYTGVFACLGIGVAMAAYLIRQKRFRQAFALAGLSLAAFLALSSPTYFIQLQHEATLAEEYPRSYSGFRFDQAAINIMRLTAEMTDTIHHSIESANHWLGVSFRDPRTSLLDGIVSLTGLDPYSQTGAWDPGGEGRAFALGVNPFAVPLGLMLLVSGGVCAVLCHKRNYSLFCLAFSCVVSLTLSCGIMSWQPRPCLRLFFPILILFMPYAALGLQSKMGSSKIVCGFVLFTYAIGISVFIWFVGSSLVRAFDADPYRFHANLYADRNEQPALHEFMQLQFCIQDYLAKTPPDQGLAFETAFVLDSLAIGERFERYAVPIKTKPEPSDIEDVFVAYPQVSLAMIATTEPGRFAIYNPHVLCEPITVLHRPASD